MRGCAVLCTIRCERPVDAAACMDAQRRCVCRPRPHATTMNGTHHNKLFRHVCRESSATCRRSDTACRRGGHGQVLDLHADDSLVCACAASKVVDPEPGRVDAQCRWSSWKAARPPPLRHCAPLSTTAWIAPRRRVVASLCGICMSHNHTQPVSHPWLVMGAGRRRLSGHA